MFIKAIVKKKESNIERHKSLKRRKSDYFKIQKKNNSSLIRLIIKKKELQTILKKATCKMLKNPKRTNPLRKKKSITNLKTNLKLRVQQQSRLKRKKLILKDNKQSSHKEMESLENQVIFYSYQDLKRKLRTKSLNDFE